MYQTEGSQLNGLIAVYEGLRTRVGSLEFSAPVTTVYNPLDYAWSIFAEYLGRFADRSQVLLVGMNPGPWGMAQTGVPFGEVTAVHDWMGLAGEIGRPASEHVKRPVLGFDCPRSEISGRRLWGWARNRFGEPQRFFDRFLVLNYCPLLFLEPSGRNRTPDRLRAADRKPLLAACDRALADAVDLLEPSQVIGVGRFAAERCRLALGDGGPAVGMVLHPSPASPAANRGWAQQAERQLREQGVDLGL